MTTLTAAPAEGRECAEPKTPLPAMRVLQVLAHLDPRLGGISAIVPRLAGELQHRKSASAPLAVFNNVLGDQQTPLQTASGPASQWPVSRLAWVRSKSLRSEFDGLLKMSAAVHIHGLWETSTAVAARSAARLGVPYIVSAHGMLETWALANKAWKKRIYSALVENGNLNKAACLHALTEAEAEDYRRFGCRRPIAVVPNGVDGPEHADAADFLKLFPQLGEKKIVLFLGRIHFKKGLDLLIPAWAECAQKHSDAVLVIAGPDSENSLLGVKKLIEQHGIADRVVFTGMLDDRLKWSALAAAQCFVLPSYSEGLSVAALEALRMALPVILSDKCHLPEVAARGAGLVVETSVPSLAKALDRILDQSSAENLAMGNHGRSLAIESYSWPSVAEKMAELYRWVAGGSRPTLFVLQEVAR